MIREFINFTIGITFLEKNLKTPFLMSFKSYADAVSGSSREEKSLAKLSNIVGITAQDYKEREVTWPCHATLHSKKKELS